MYSTDVSPGAAAVPDAALGMRKTLLFSQKDSPSCTWERRGKDANVRAGFVCEANVSTDVAEGHKVNTGKHVVVLNPEISLCARERWVDQGSGKGLGNPSIPDNDRAGHQNVHENGVAR